MPRTKKSKYAATLLTKNQRKFCEIFALESNAAAAYGKAFPSSMKHEPAYRANKANKLLRKAHIRDHLAQLTEKVKQTANDKFGITAERVLAELANVAFQNAQDYFEWGTYERPERRKNKETGRFEIVRDDAGNPVMESVPFARIKPSADLDRAKLAAVVSVSETISRTGDRIVEAKMADKLAALRMLAQHFGMFKKDEAAPGAGAVNHTGVVQHVHTLPDLSGIKDPRDALRAFEAFRQGLPPAGHA